MSAFQTHWHFPHIDFSNALFSHFYFVRALGEMKQLRNNEVQDFEYA